MTFKTILLATAASTMLATGAFADAHSAENPMVGGAEMLADQPIAVNASNAPNLTTLVAAVTQAELVDVLAGEGEFTVFAPTNDAFAAVDPATVEFLMMDENREALQGILTYHVVPGTITAADLVEAVNTREFANYTTVAGGTITAQLQGDNVVIFDENGNFATVETADVMQSNGVVHVIDSVLLPAS